MLLQTFHKFFKSIAKFKKCQILIENIVNENLSLLVLKYTTLHFNFASLFYELVIPREMVVMMANDSMSFEKCGVIDEIIRGAIVREKDPNVRSCFFFCEITPECSLYIQYPLQNMVNRAFQTLVFLSIKDQNSEFQQFRCPWTFRKGQITISRISSGSLGQFITQSKNGCFCLTPQYRYLSFWLCLWHFWTLNNFPWYQPSPIGFFQ